MATSMILDSDFQDKELNAFRLGEMRNGLKIGCALDKHLVFKFGQFNLILGHDNVGKTFFMLWYFVMLSIKHNLTWAIYCSENEIWSCKSKIISFYQNRNYKSSLEVDYIKAKSWCDNHFTFVDNRLNYTAPELLEVFESVQCEGYLIDPYNSLSKGGQGGHDYEYEVASSFRAFTRKFNRSIYINMHPVTEATRIKHRDGQFDGLLSPPMKSHAEGGTKWPSRCDDFIILHRYWLSGHENTTYVDIQKIKETETGGQRTLDGQLLPFIFSDYGFSVHGVNPFENKLNKPIEEIKIVRPNGGMENFKEIPDPEDVDMPF